jgi:ABC-type glutathione transport system ATPase component
MMPAAMQVRLRAGYGKHCVLDDLQFELRAGESLGLLGSSGAGKTTLVTALLGLLPWRGGSVAGQVLIEEGNLLAMTAREARRVRGSRIALVPQSPMTALNPAVSLRAHFEEAWRAHEPSRKTLQPRLIQLLEEVQLPVNDESFLRRKPGQISVGQAQRVLIALALLHRPSILIADEPTSALDLVTQAEIIRLLSQLTRNSRASLLYISHDLVSVLQLSDRIAVLHEGSIVESLATMQIEQARHPATLSLLRALPVPVELLLSRFGRNAQASREAGLPDSGSVCLAHSALRGA